MSKTEHYKNHPNDIEASPREKNLSRKLNQLMHKFKIFAINNTISIMLRNSQIKSDTQIKDMFIEMYPEEFKLVLKATIDRYGQTERGPLRKEEIIQSMNLKDRNILREKR